MALIKVASSSSVHSGTSSSFTIDGKCFNKFAMKTRRFPEKETQLKKLSNTPTKKDLPQNVAFN